MPVTADCWWSNWQLTPTHGVRASPPPMSIRKNSSPAGDLRDNHSHQFFTDLSVTSWIQQTYLDVQGTDLGVRILEVLEQQKARIATESTPTEIAPTSPAREAGDEPPLREVEVQPRGHACTRKTRKFFRKNSLRFFVCFLVF